MRAEHLRRTHALLRPETAVAAAEALRGSLGKAEVEGLVELVHSPRTAKEALVALSVLDDSASPLVLEALAAALESTHASVRIVAVQTLHRRRARHADAALVRLLEQDESWLVRRAALEA